MNWSSTAMRWLEIVMYCMILNGIWLLGVVIGFGVLGLFPASYALLRIFYDEEFFESQNSIFPIIKKFSSYYFKGFLKANGIGLFYYSLAGVWYIDWYILQQQPILQAFLTVPTILMGLYLLETLIFLTPIVSIENGSWKEKIKLLIMVPFLLPKATLLHLLIFIILFILTQVFPAGFFLFFTAAGAFLVHKVSSLELYKKQIIM
ncbi:DUF624 domain-containing protein [Jeotgalibaca caeni]|uniref:DUF624 domain-containing protein n=1 Tax=Jeotgalibaca caeni TaxID=3028623 RepID=UPI00237DA1ED|nr:DUF624 domain-containing protein [Jeotgalibaca caeni]MDE1549580.1 DUF624 domain-containing protein [Jeotgalibaca caeni]